MGNITHSHFICLSVSFIFTPITTTIIKVYIVITYYYYCEQNRGDSKLPNQNTTGTVGRVEEDNFTGDKFKRSGCKVDRARCGKEQ